MGFKGTTHEPQIYRIKHRKEYIIVCKQFDFFYEYQLQADSERNNSKTEQQG